MQKDLWRNTAMKEYTPYENGGIGAHIVYSNLWWTSLNQLTIQ